MRRPSLVQTSLGKPSVIEFTRRTERRAIRVPLPQIPMGVYIPPRHVRIDVTRNPKPLSPCNRPDRREIGSGSISLAGALIFPNLLNYPWLQSRALDLMRTNRLKPAPLIEGTLAAARRPVATLAQLYCGY